MGRQDNLQMGHPWLALVVGNSRLHWAAFDAETLMLYWHTAHVSAQSVQEWVDYFPALTQLHQDWPVEAIRWLTGHSSAPIPIWCASVVPGQEEAWSRCPNMHVLSLLDIPLQAMYATLGIDRALALWGAGHRYGFPQLVIDAGTALTFTGADGQAVLKGGAILPGLRTQWLALASRTAQLPNVMWQAGTPLPQRWAKDTSGAIASGVIWTVLAGLRDFIEDWRRTYPSSGVVLTGGDADLLWSVLNGVNPALTATLHLDPAVIFWGIQSCRSLSALHRQGSSELG